MANNAPIKKFKAGNVTVSVWENSFLDDKKVPKTSNSVTLEKAYKNDKGEWKNTGSLNVNEMPKAIIALQEAYKFLVINDQKGEEEN